MLRRGVPSLRDDSAGHQTWFAVLRAAVIRAIAPDGFEDETGFHYGGHPGFGMVPSDQLISDHENLPVKTALRSTSVSTVVLNSFKTSASNCSHGPVDWRSPSP